MKIDVSRIIRDHAKTLRNDASGSLSVIDIAIFYVLPFVAGVFVCILGLACDRDFYNASLTFFGVFVALLLNFQVAAFGIYTRHWERQSDEKLKELQRSDLEIRRTLLREINSNISYLILVSVVAIFFYLVAYAVRWAGLIPVFLSSVLYAHFLLTILMVVKRSHILFLREYETS